MARRRKGLRRRPFVASLLQTAQHSASEAGRALDRGDCAEAADLLIHAYQLRGEAEGYTRALRESKGRKGQGISVLDDRRVAALGRLKVRLRRACAIKGG